MIELNLLEDYPSPKNIRFVGQNLRTITNRIIASKRGKDFFDGDRNFGYGGFRYDGRWVPIAKKINSQFLKKANSKFLQINCEKGFLLQDISTENPLLSVYGTETSKYAIDNSLENVKKNIIFANPTELPFDDNYFDFVIALGAVYTLTLEDALKCLTEIVRVSKSKSFITLATYETSNEYFLFKDWTLLGTLLLKRSEWLEVLKYVGYKGYYYFTDSNTLNLQRKS